MSQTFSEKLLQEDPNAAPRPDPWGVAVTAPRQAMSARLAQRIVELRPDRTEEVRLEDILLEVYAQDLPPELVPASVDVAPTSVKVAASLHAGDARDASDASDAIKATVAGPASTSRSSPCAPRPSAHAYPPSGAPGFDVIDQETPSVAPIAFACDEAPSAPSLTASSRTASKRRGVLAISALALLVVSVGAGATLASLVFQIGKVGRPVSAPAREKDGRSAAAQPPVALAPAAQPAGVVVPTFSVSSLPAAKLAIPDDSSVVTFPPSAHGHRAFFDGRFLAVTSEPMMLRCGRHMVRVGSAGRARVTDLPCGGEITLSR